MLRIVIGIFLLLPLSVIYAEGNESIESFNKAKKYLLQQVYFDHRSTLYCQADFDNLKSVRPLLGFRAIKYKKRAQRIEWEHVVPAENFGRTFSEWRDGHPRCVDKKGKAYKGRRCATKMNTNYRLMQADLHNLFPAIGAVNALRRNHSFRLMPEASSDFGSCSMKVDKGKAEPPTNARGVIARTYLYMDQAYQRYRLSPQQRKLFHAWDVAYPVTDWECRRANRIFEIQGNDNNVVKARCLSSSLAAL